MLGSGSRAGVAGRKSQRRNMSYKATSFAWEMASRLTRFAGSLRCIKSHRSGWRSAKPSSAPSLSLFGMVRSAAAVDNGRIRQELRSLAVRSLCGCRGVRGARATRIGHMAKGFAFNPITSKKPSTLYTTISLSIASQRACICHLPLAIPFAIFCSGPLLKTEGKLGRYLPAPTHQDPDRGEGVDVWPSQ